MYPTYVVILVFPNGVKVTADIPAVSEEMARRIFLEQWRECSYSESMLLAQMFVARKAEEETSDDNA